MPFIFYAIAVYALIFCTSYIIIFQRLLRVPIRYPQYQLVTLEAIPVELQALYQQPIQALGELGFQVCGYLQIESMIGFEGCHNWEVLLYHKDHKSYAGLTTRRPVESVNIFDIEFYTFFKDRRLLLTMNGKAHGLIGEIPNTIVQDPFTPDLTVLWQTHLDKLTELKANIVPCGLAPATFVQAMQEHFTAHVDALQKLGQIIPIPGTALFKLSWKLALQMAIQIRQGNGKATTIAKKRRDRAKTDPTILVEVPLLLELDSFHYMRNIEQGHVKRKFGVWVLLISLGLFIASFLPFFDLQFMLLLIGTLFLHELGHYLAMRLFRYQDTTMFFLPFFGAAVTGRKDDASLSEKVWVLLAGPMPGMLLGIGIAIATRGSTIPTYAREGIWMLIGLNLLNLLPIYPLDGGKIANLLLFSRYPFTDVLFKIFAVIVLVLLGLGSPFIWAIALVVAMTIPAGFRSAKVDTRLRRQSSALVNHDNSDSLVVAIFQHMRELGYGALPFAQRYNLAKDLLQRHRESHAKWTTRTLLTVLYVASLLVGIVGSVGAVVQTSGWHRETSSFLNKRKAVYNQQIAEATQALQTNPNDAKAYLKRGTAYYELRQYQKAIADYTQVVQREPKNLTAYQKRAWAHYEAEDYQAAIADANQMLKLSPKTVEAYAIRSFAYRRLGDLDRAQADEKQVAALRQAQQTAIAKQILRTTPKSASDYVKRAGAHYQLRNYKAAIADASQAIQLDPKLQEAYELRSEAHQQMGDRQKAAADQQKLDVLQGDAAN